MMKLEDQVCNLKLSKKLKELGVKQESLFYWLDGNVMSVDKIEWARIEFNSELTTYSLKEIYSAFTVAELGEGLPESIITKQCPDSFYLSITKLENNIWEVCYVTDTDYTVLHYTQDLIEANARALMRIYLIENGLVKI